MTSHSKCYIGDSVYAELQDGMIRLTTENGFGPSNEIFLEPQVFDSLVMFGSRVFKRENPDGDTEG